MSSVKNKSFNLESNTLSLPSIPSNNHISPSSSSISRRKSMGNLVPSVLVPSSHNQQSSAAHYFHHHNHMMIGCSNGSGGGGGGSGSSENRTGSNSKRSGTNECSPSSCSSSKSCSSSSSYENTYCSASSCDCKQRRGTAVTMTNSWSSSISNTTVTTAPSSSSCSSSGGSSSFASSSSSCSNPSSNSNSVDDFDDEGSLANRLRSKRIKYDPSTSSSYNDGSGYSNDLSSIFNTTDTSLCGSNSHSSEVSSTSSKESNQKSESKSSFNSSRPITRNNSRMLTVETEPPPSLIDAEVKSNPASKTKLTILSTKKTCESDMIGKKCLWYRCNFICDDKSTNPTDEFIDHVKQKHIQPQKTFHKYRCLWANCSVYGQASLSRTWLERHVIDHVAKCPYPCIFNGCNRRFRTEMLREKHVQSHINSSQASQISSTTSTLYASVLSNSNTPNDSGAISSRLRQQNSGSNLDAICKTSNTPVKTENNKEAVIVDYKSKITHILKSFRKRKANASEQLKRFRKANYKDFFDICSLQLCTARLRDLDIKSGYVTLRAHIVACDQDINTGKEFYLVEWEPKNIIDSEWIEKSALSITKKLSVEELAKRFSKSSVNPFYRRHRFRQNKRK